MTENLSSRYRIEVRRMRRKPRATSSAECDVEVGRLELTQINIDRERKKGTSVKKSDPISTYNPRES